jgi:hypothetical protein
VLRDLGGLEGIKESIERDGLREVERDSLREVERGKWLDL